MQTLKRKIEQCEKELEIQVEKIDEQDAIMDELHHENNLYPILDYYDIDVMERPDDWEESVPSSPPDYFLSSPEEDEPRIMSPIQLSSSSEEEDESWENRAVYNLSWKE